MRVQMQGQSKRRTWFSRRNLGIAIIVAGAIATISILAWKNSTRILDIWSKTLWLHWIIFVCVVLFTIVSALLWVFRSQGIVRKSRTIFVVLAAIAIGAGIWILSTLGIFPSVVANVMLAIFTASAAAFTFLQWVNPLAPQISDIHHSMLQMTSATGFSPTLYSSPQQPANNTTEQSPSPTEGTSSQSASSTQSEGIDFFISYAAADLSCAQWIERVLREAKYSTFFPEYDMGPGSNVPQELNRATAIAKQTLLVLSPDYPLADHPEWAVAFYKDMSGKGRKLIPVYVRKCPGQLQGVLAPIVPIDLVDKGESEAQEWLLDGVFSGDKRKGQTPPKFPGLSLDNHGTDS